jgi:signal transduction histidine kinase
MRRFRTLRGRLTAFALIGATIAVALVIIAFNLILARVLNADIDSRLRTHAAAAATTVRASDGSVSVRESPSDEAIDSRVWVFAGTRPVLRPKASPPLQRTADALAGRSRVFSEVPDETRFYALPITDGGRQVGTVVAGQSLEAYDRTTDFALIASVALGAFLLAAVYAVTRLTIGRALDPVRGMTRSAAEWSEHDLDRRFGPAQRPDELGELARTFDALLDRLAASLRHEQRLSAELSHELRTPLARILAEIELLQRRERSPDDRREAYDVVARSAEQMSRILETLMAAARADAQPGRGRSDLRRAFSDLAQSWTEPLAQRGVQLVIPPGREPLDVGVDADVVERVIAPLLDNAGRYARSQVTIETTRDEGRLRVTVSDDGPGLGPGEAESVFEPGVRGTPVNGNAGAGLGLALSRRLARAVGGDVTAAADATSGTAFVVELPA